MLSYVQHAKLELRSHSDFDEAWLQERIVDEPTILGLGDLTLVDRERRQGKAGRLDLLFSDSDQSRRYEVELMLGPTDPDHLIRTIEYWDIERRKFPAYDHVAVLVAEDITTRFLNVLALFSGSIPLVAIQLNALRVNDSIVLNFVRILDQVALRTDDTSIDSFTETMDRAYWETRAVGDALTVADDVLAVINSEASRPYLLNYNKQFVGLTDGVRSRNFIHFKPRKQFCWVIVNISDPSKWVVKFDTAGLEVNESKAGRLRIQTTRASLEENATLFQELVKSAVVEYEE